MTTLLANLDTKRGAMATWDDVRNWIGETRTGVQGLGPHGVQFTVQGDNGRSQLVIVHHRTTQMELGGQPYVEEWAAIVSPIGRIDQLDLRALVVATAELDLVCGGIGVFQNEVYVLRHAVPLTNLDANEIHIPILVIAGEADRLEAAVSGVDRF